MPKHRIMSCVFSSGLFIRSEDIATLAVFFDEIFLPYPYDVDPNAGKLPGFKDAGIVGLGTFFLEAIQKEFDSWRQRYSALFNAGILRTLPPPIKGTDNYPTDYLDILHSSKASRSHLERGKVSHWNMALGIPALALFAAYSKKPAPELFFKSTTGHYPIRFLHNSTESDASTFSLTAALAKSLFSYQFPELAALTADQILEVREFLKDEKEGFVLSKLNRRRR